MTAARISSNGSCFEFSGPPGAPVVALIHGLGLDRHTWDKYVSRFSNRYRVLNYDLYGHGDSAAPPRKASLSLFAEQLADLLDELRIERCVPIGFSLGGMINRRFAIDYPERVQALAILNSPHEREPEAQRQVEQRAVDSAAGGPGANLEVTLARWFTAEFRQSGADRVARVGERLLANDPDSYAQSREVLAFGVTELIRPQPPISAPTLVMTCEHDSGSTPAMSQAIAAEIDGAQVVIVPGLQHMGLIENPSFFITALAEFLEDELHG